MVQAKASLVERTFFASVAAFWLGSFASVFFILPIRPRSVAKATPTKTLDSTTLRQVAIAVN